jgi:hypothetical protein
LTWSKSSRGRSLKQSQVSKVKIKSVIILHVLLIVCVLCITRFFLFFIKRNVNQNCVCVHLCVHAERIIRVHHHELVIRLLRNIRHFNSIHSFLFHHWLSVLLPSNLLTAIFSIPPTLTHDPAVVGTQGHTTFASKTKT